MKNHLKFIRLQLYLTCLVLETGRIVATKIMCYLLAITREPANVKIYSMGFWRVVFS